MTLMKLMEEIQSLLVYALVKIGKHQAQTHHNVMLVGVLGLS